MADQHKQPQEPEQQIYGAQGNEGQYGQGQYDSEGKPDSHGPQSQKIHPDDQQQKEKAVAEQRKKASAPKFYLDVPLD
jgi:hypothetical protein